MSARGLSIAARLVAADRAGTGVRLSRSEVRAILEWNPDGAQGGEPGRDPADHQTEESARGAVLPAPEADGNPLWDDAWTADTEVW